ncbi:NAD(P)-dependent oxidoreductase [Pseudomonas sp. Gutcm_11s]|uniref:NAD(P)-dependent oxidoreductase n=1 Tax=Pseudomonas sp. Gutcm_11s TaxID=3026088 RepID=UPI00235F3C4D|nr:NAD(P)H-binding protein [Pseudomonas sp. Gutcm_11s]MDD0843551.1 NAD(P)H-binding protein [Pseudomonas sp. Gutcm_11s]
MHNLETPTFKLVLYGAHSSLGSALLAEALHRQYEATAILTELNSVRARPGLRTKGGELFDPIGVSQSVAGMDAVIALLDAGQPPGDFSQHFNALLALLDGLETAGVPRLLVVDDFDWMNGEPTPDSPVHHLEERLLASPVSWTLAQAPEQPSRLLEIDDFRQPDTTALPLQRFAIALLDEMRLALHRHQRIHIDLHGGKG